LSTIADALSNSIANYYNPSQSSKRSTAEKQQLKFKVGISDSPILVKFIPERLGAYSYNRKIQYG
jgi:uncharacterized protein (DUF2164 family)